MKISDKLISLRRQHGYSQEELAEKLNVSRQAVSRWESNQSLPDTINIIQLTKIYHVSADYLLNDEYDYENDMPIVKYTEDRAAKRSLTEMTYILSMCIGVVATIIGLAGYFIIKSDVVVLISLVMSIFSVACFEAGIVRYCSNGRDDYRRRFYNVTLWLILLIPSLITTEITYTLFSIIFGRIFPFVPGLLIRMIYEVAVYATVVCIAKCILKRMMDQSGV